MARIWMLLLMSLGGVMPVLAAESVAATYRLVTTTGDAPRESRFLLLRAGDLVEVRDLHTGAAERWERGPDGRLHYARVFLEVRKLIEFQPADLATARIPGDWDTISTVTGRAVLARLERVAGHRADGRRVESYRGDVDGVRSEIDWLPEIELPARVVREAGGWRSELDLQTLETGAAVQALLTPPEVLRSCETIDFADLGDRHGDPVVERLMQAGGLDVHQH